MSSDVAAAVAARGSYMDWLRDVTALVNERYPDQAHILKGKIGEDEIVSVFVNQVVS